MMINKLMNRPCVANYLALAVCFATAQNGVHCYYFIFCSKHQNKCIVYSCSFWVLFFVFL